MTDGQLPLRQCLHPEACRKDLDLPTYYSIFHDLRKEVAKFTAKGEEPPQSIATMLERILFQSNLYNFFYNYARYILKLSMM